MFSFFLVGYTWLWLISGRHFHSYSFAFILPQILLGLALAVNASDDLEAAAGHHKKYLRYAALQQAQQQQAPVHYVPVQPPPPPPPTPAIVHYVPAPPPPPPPGPVHYVPVYNKHILKKQLKAQKHALKHGYHGWTSIVKVLFRRAFPHHTATTL